MRDLLDQYGHSEYLLRAGKQDRNALPAVVEIRGMFLVVHLVPDMQAWWPC